MTEQLMTTLSGEEHERLLLVSENAIDPPLSPSAAAVLFAGASESEIRKTIAAALRATVKHTAKQKVLTTLGVAMCKSPVYCLESDLLTIAGELDPL